MCVWGYRERHRNMKAEAELLQDTLTCGSCQKVFVLSEIVKFIQHKVHSCNKENILLAAADPPNDDDGDAAPLVAVPSISAPICNRKNHHHNNHRVNSRFEQQRQQDGQQQQEAFKKDLEDVKKLAAAAKEMPVIKQEVKDPALRCSPKSMVNAYTNTIITEPSTYTCSTCKQTFTSAWVLVQHAQHMHGMKIYLVTPYHGSRSSNTSSAASTVPPPPPPSLLPLPPVLPPCSSMNGPHHHFENHPALQLLRMPLGERQFPNNLFARPPSQDFRVDALAASSAPGEQFQHHRMPPLPFDPPPFMERPPRPPMSLGFEPQMDFYSQRLRQLAGATSPTPPPASSKPNFPPPSQPSTPSPALNLHAPTTAAAASSASSTASSSKEVPPEASGGASPHKNWPCEFCGKSFRFESNLVVHRRSHTGERPYKCPVCSHACTQASKLKRHMKTHQQPNGKTPSESPRSTPDSTSEAAKDLSRNEVEEEEEGSDGGQTADNEEEEEEDLDEDDDEEEEDLDEDDEDDSMMAEDLSTRGPNSSTPDKKVQEAVVNNDNNSSNTISISNDEKESSPKSSSSPAAAERHSLLGEVMDKIGLSNIQQYNEAYKKALEESSLKNKEDGPPPRKSPVVENDTNHHGSKNGKHNNNNNALVLHQQHSMEFGHGFFGAFDYSHRFESKRLKLDEHRERDSLYAGLWHPGYDHPLSRHTKSSSSESALKSVTPSNVCSRSLSPRPGTSGGAPPLGLLAKGGGGKEQRRNDTCEFCGKVFKNCSNLTVHRRSHTGEKPYKCELCSYACAQSSKLTRHMKTHGRLGKDVYRCRFCDMPFSVPSTLEKHMRKCVVNQNASGGGVTYIDRDSDSKDLT